MWILNTRPVAGTSTIGASISTTGDSLLLTCADVLRLWRTDEAFCRFWSAAIGGIPFEACFWETPPWSLDSLGQPFECVFVDSPDLAAIEASPAPFREHLLGKGNAGSVASFDNLGRNAHLIAPCPVGDGDNAYAHLASFVRTAPEAQANLMWNVVAQSVEPRLRNRKAPIWLSTCGLGVYWVHIRVDASPKYYQYEPYTASDFWSE